ncbi:MAG: elongation factor 1-alpha C-terminal domain-related protein, partial [Flavobacteriales bacterium]
NNLLKVKDVIVAVNKMDLVEYSEEVFNDIKRDFEALNAKSTYQEQNVSYIPVSALKGDNIVKRTDAMAWYDGETILGHLENLEAADVYEKGQVRFPVQSVIRPKKDEYHDFRGYAGKIYGGSLRVGDEVTVLPSLTQSKVKEIYFFDKKYDEAVAGSSVNITLEDDINITRGDMLVKSNELPKIEKQITATVCWMDSKQLLPGSKYMVQHNTNKVLSKIDVIKNVVSTEYIGVHDANNKLALNEIGEVSIKLSRPIYFDAYKDNKANGSFILIDTQSNTTAGVGFIN